MYFKKVHVVLIKVYVVLLKVHNYIQTTYKLHTNYIQTTYKLHKKKYILFLDEIDTFQAFFDMQTFDYIVFVSYVQATVDVEECKTMLLVMPSILDNVPAI